MTKFYTGIGARDTPAPILAVMRKLAGMLERQGYILRSGGAIGADTAFEMGVSSPSKMEIYLPWHGYNYRLGGIVLEGEKLQQALSLAAAFHPAWHNCGGPARKLHARNVGQLLGPNLDNPSHMVICWTKDGQASGGTGQAIRMANGFEPRIKVHNLYHPDKLKRAQFLIDSEIFI